MLRKMTRVFVALAAAVAIGTAALPADAGNATLERRVASLEKHTRDLERRLRIVERQLEEPIDDCTVVEQCLEGARRGRLHDQPQ